MGFFRYLHQFLFFNMKMKSGNCCAATRPPQFPGCFGEGAGWVPPSRLLGARHPLQSHGKRCSLRQENCLWLRSGPAGAAPKPFPRPFCPFSEYFFFFPRVISAAHGGFTARKGPPLSPCPSVPGRGFAVGSSRPEDETWGWNLWGLPDPLGGGTRGTSRAAPTALGSMGVGLFNLLTDHPPNAFRASGFFHGKGPHRFFLFTFPLRGRGARSREGGGRRGDVDLRSVPLETEAPGFTVKRRGGLSRRGLQATKSENVTKPEFVAEKTCSCSGGDKFPLWHGAN